MGQTSRPRVFCSDPASVLTVVGGLYCRWDRVPESLAGDVQESKYPVSCPQEEELSPPCKRSLREHGNAKCFVPLSRFFLLIALVGP